MRKSVIYKDWKENKEPLGTAFLVKKLQEGLPFIPLKADSKRNSEKEYLTLIYLPEKWEVRWESLTNLGLTYVHKERTSFWIRRKKWQGLMSSGRPTSVPLSHREVEVEDRFLKINGCEIF